MPSAEGHQKNERQAKRQECIHRVSHTTGLSIQENPLKRRDCAEPATTPKNEGEEKVPSTAQKDGELKMLTTEDYDDEGLMNMKSCCYRINRVQTHH